MQTSTQAEALSSFTAWGQAQPLVRAILLTSTRAIPGAADSLSDYDLILALSDLQPFLDRAWLADFGRVLVMYQDPLSEEDGLQSSGNVVQFEEGLKIDFSLWPVKMLHRVAAQPQLPPEFDAGYQVLLDKDGLTAGLRPPSGRGYIPQPPTQERYLAAIEDFFLVAIYVAKYLRRGDLVAAQHLMEDFLRQEDLLPILEWHIQLDHAWSARTGLYGRRLHHLLRPDLYAALAGTYVPLAAPELWAALYRAIDLLRAAAGEVGERLSYPYPADMERRVLAFLKKLETQDLRSSL